MYILIEYILNGSHMMNPCVVAFNMNFEESVEKMKELLIEKVGDKYKLEIFSDTDKEFSYVIRGGFLPLVGIIKNEKLLIHEKVR